MPQTESTPSLFDEFSAVSPEDWRAAVRADLGTDDPDAFLEWSSMEGVSLPAYLHREDLEGLPHVDPTANLSPLAEGAEPPANDWALCQDINHPDPETAQAHARAALDGGADALRVQYAPASPDGTSLRLASPSDLALLLNDIDLSATALHLDRGPGALVLYAALREHLSDQDIDASSIHGSVGYDPVAAVAEGGGMDMESAFALAHDLGADADALPHVRTVGIDSRVYHNAGASAVQELACTLGALAERLARATEQGLDLAALRSELHVHVPVATSYFIAVAKLRALRLLVPQVVAPFLDNTDSKDSFSPSDVSLHAETSRRSDTRYDPYVNMLRATTEAMAATVGGCDTLSVRPYDAALQPPDAFGQRIARNTQLVLRHEAHTDQVADPAAGSYYVEILTDRLAQQAWEQFQDLEAGGGILNALRSGTLQQQVAETRQKRLDAIDTREQVLVGTTHYPDLDEHRRDDSSSAPPSASGRSHSPPAPSSIETLREELRSGTAPADLHAALVSDSPVAEPLPRLRIAADIESIRLRTERYADTHGAPPRILLAPLGPPAARSARATFARNFLGVAGFAIEEPLAFETVDDAAEAALDADADVVVLCSSNSEYTDLAPTLATALADRDHDAFLGVAGSPEDIDTGGHADFFLHRNSSLKDTLSTLQDNLGMSVQDEP
jgi:methylmalonyl-CoA mutase